MELPGFTSLPALSSGLPASFSMADSPRCFQGIPAKTKQGPWGMVEVGLKIQDLGFLLCVQSLNPFFMM